MTLTVESVTALRNLHTAPTDASNPQEEAARGETSAHPPQRQGAARPAESNGNKRQRPNPRPDLKRGRDGDGSASAGGATPARTALIEENKRMRSCASDVRGSEGKDVLSLASYGRKSRACAHPLAVPSP